MDQRASTQRAVAAYLAERLREARHSRARQASKNLRDRQRRARRSHASA